MALGTSTLATSRLTASGRSTLRPLQPSQARHRSNTDGNRKGSTCTNGKAAERGGAVLRSTT
jgi:hypothetical protein